MIIISFEKTHKNDCFLKTMDVFILETNAKTRVTYRILSISSDKY